VVETRTTSIQLVAGFSGNAFAEVHPQKVAILLDIRSAAPLTSLRVRKVEQVSKHKFHNERLLVSPDDVHGERLRWLKAAYEPASRAE
jgi:hypothetical protein